MLFSHFRIIIFNCIVFQNNCVKRIIAGEFRNPSSLAKATAAAVLMVGRSYVGHDVTHSTLVDRTCTTARVPTEIFLNIVPTACLSNTAPWALAEI